MDFADAKEEIRERLDLVEVIGQYVRWLMITLAAGMVTFGGPEARSHAPTVYLMLLVASCYNVALYVIPWRRLEEAGRGNLIVIPYVLADTTCISVVTYATGKIDSSYYLAYLLLVVWMAIYPGTRERRWLWLILLTSYAVAVFSDGQATSNAIYSFMMRAIIFGSVAWLSGRIAHELHLATSRVETAVTDLTDGLVVLDRAGRVLLMNPRSVELLGVSEAEALRDALRLSRGMTYKAAVAGLNLGGGKSVLIGPVAIELGDWRSVPRFRALPGPLVQALAFETITQGRALYPIQGWPAALGAALLVVALGPAFGRLSAGRGYGPGGPPARLPGLSARGGAAHPSVSGQGSSPSTRRCTYRPTTRAEAKRGTTTRAIRAPPRASPLKTAMKTIPGLRRIARPRMRGWSQRLSTTWIRA